ncbi:MULTISPECIES: hypothetical protein [Pseudomonas]|jgi:hypothetical protein|uniref:Uncharacterized protein n=2 Tax=Pseudomonas putida group TaxID=136845 RepID=Q88J76_PSEPK|nr:MULTISPECIES: hypothetical protein [Pseudomonas]AAN68381.1 conserved protein of unknown function [Pseudomonas putida KT2440]MBP2838946.1 hypothetical protein [Pseudomonas sp. PNP]MCE0860211.1 hypothetical protein [Pseudomonas alloputida]MCE0866129.1 hypothetical protein [Pseudomonas alloputida]MCE0889332.1 hypothetical protein [Pseudomonas alloputida]
MPTSLLAYGQSLVLLPLHPLFSFFQALTLPAACTPSRPTSATRQAYVLNMIA